MPELLTVRQLQEILQVDRTTIYRMLDEGILPGFKVGSQWRFSRQAIERWLKSQQGPSTATRETGITEMSHELLPLSCVQPIQDVFAEALSVGAITTDAEGNPFTEFSNKTPFCRLINSTEAGRARCRQSWAELGHRQKREPEFARCHAGLSYACGRVEVNGQLVAMTFTGQFVVEPPESAFAEKHVRDLAVACGVKPDDLVDASRTVRIVSTEEAQRIMRLLERIADTFCHIGQERADLINRLERIAEITGTVVGGQRPAAS